MNSRPWGTLNAVDLTTGQIKWQVALGTYPRLEKKGHSPTGTFNIVCQTTNSTPYHIFQAKWFTKRIAACTHGLLTIISCHLIAATIARDEALMLGHVIVSACRLIAPKTVFSRTSTFFPRSFFS